MSQTIVLISGANRGLGEGLLQLYLAKPNHIVVAANRNPADPTSKALSKIPVAANSRLIVVKVEATSETDTLEAVKQLTSQGIDHLDVVIANSGICYICPKVSDVKIDQMKDHFGPNVYGAVLLYQATLPLLLKSESPIWATMGSTAGSLQFLVLCSYAYLPPYSAPPPVTNAAYGPTKAAVHWLTKRINAEEKKLNAFILSPGWVQTETGNRGAREFGLEKAEITVEVSVNGMIRVLAEAKKESHGGRMWSYDGEEIPL